MTIETQVIPTRKGQVVKILKPLLHEDPNESYLLAEDPTPYDNRKRLLIYSMTEIIRNKHNGTLPFADQVEKGDLTVVGNSLKEWVNSWNSNTIN
jgi:hypothetical protein